MRTLAYAGVVPTMVVVVFWPPATTNSLVVSSGATAAIPLSRAMALASSVVSVVAEPRARNVPPLRLRPGLIVSRFVPRP